jgi:hypothetical protein
MSPSNALLSLVEITLCLAEVGFVGNDVSSYIPKSSRCIQGKTRDKLEENADEGQALL